MRKTFCTFVTLLTLSMILAACALHYEDDRRKLDIKKQGTEEVTYGTQR